MPAVTKRILLLSAYDAASHKYWRQQLQHQLPEFNWTQLALPARHFNWRIRSNAMQLASREYERLTQSHDLLIATSMVDLATLRGLIPDLAQIPSVLYFHENQFAYPAGQQRKENVEPVLVPLYSALCAEQVAFNSAFNRASCIEGTLALSKRLPEALPTRLFEKLEASLVLPVPLVPPPEFSATHHQHENIASVGESATGTEALEVVWNHRWEYDKGIGLLAEIVALVQKQGLPIRFHIVGQQFRDKPRGFSKIEDSLAQISEQSGIARGAFGYVKDREDYQRLLKNAHVVLSTADHDFQGLAVQEACLAGCQALVPDALVYPEYIPKHQRFDVYEDIQKTAIGAVEILAAKVKQRQSGELLPPPNLSAFWGEPALAPYRDLIKRLIR
jgi:glycosyltransferase involved in cell wall biosynthesis